MRIRALSLTTLALLLASCGGDAPRDDAAARQANWDATTWLLKTEPEGAVPVLQARQQAPGTEVTVVGRLRDFEPGFAALMLTDQSVAYCGDGECSMDGCPTPWDYCCRPKQASEGSLPVELRDESGKVVETDALGLRLLDLVTVRGTLEKTEAGGLMLVTKQGWFRRERPELPANLNWSKH